MKMTDKEFAKNERKLIKLVLAFAEENHSLILAKDTFGEDLQEEHRKLP